MEALRDTGPVETRKRLDFVPIRNHDPFGVHARAGRFDIVAAACDEREGGTKRPD